MNFDQIVNRNRLIFYTTQLLHSLVFTAPIWIVFYQSRITIPELTILVTFQYLIQMAFEVPSGALADLIGRRNTNLLGFVMGAMGYLLFPFASNIIHFALLTFLMGAADSFRSGSEEALIFDTYKQANRESEYGKIYANSNMIYQLGLILSSALGGIMYDFQVMLPYVVYGSCLALGAFIGGLYIEPVIDSEKFSVNNFLIQMRDGAKEATRTEYSKYLSLFYIFVWGIAWSSTLYFNEYILIDLGFGNTHRGLMFAAMRAINVVIIASVLKNQRLFNFKRSVLFFPIVMLLAFLPGKFLDGFFGVPFIQLAMIATTARWIILSPMTNAVFSSKYRATAISILSLLIGVVYIGLTGISGFVIANFGIRAMYSLLGILSAVTVLPLSIKLITLKTSGTIGKT